MQLTEEILQKNWWAEGDTPVRSDSRVTFLVDGRHAMLEMCRHFLKARKYIYLANWGITPTMQLVRGPDHRAGPDGSSAQEALLEDLRLAGLSEADIAFWNTHELTVQAVLGYAVSKGVEVKALPWDCSPIFSHYSPQKAYEELVEVGVTCIRDDSSRGILHHQIESLHQKISIVDGTHAFVGGVDLLIESSGDFDRWDTPWHHFLSKLRVTKPDIIPHSWHDAHALIEGTAAGDVEYNFRQRWNDVVKRHHMDEQLLVPEREPTPLQTEQKYLVQVARTIPKHTYKFSPSGGIQGIAQLYAHAFNNAQRFIYLENQYFWLRAYFGIDISPFGIDSPDMERNLRELVEALGQGATLALILPDHPNVGRGFTDAAIIQLRKEAPEAAAEGRIQVFCLATSTERDGKQHYRPVYVHAKVAIIDDTWATVGSGNLNNRGMRDDTEMNVAVLDPERAIALRMLLWAEHLGIVKDDEQFAVTKYLGHQRQRARSDERAEKIWQSLQETLRDPQAGLRIMVKRAQDNLQRFRAGQPLVGHLLPYLTQAEAEQQKLPFRENHGWVEEADFDKPENE